MSDEQYRVIAREWRPKTFEEVIGQPHATRTLQNAIRLKRIAHAYLFSGARGVGKTSVARILAKALNCEKGPAPTPCGQCSNCLEISKTNSVDVIEIDGASNRGIDNIRELRETVRYRPAKGRYKIYIIDEVHMLTAEAFNALLKTLEEPPAHVIFIFATTEPHKIPATILSRCQRFDFRRLSVEQIAQHLKKISLQQNAHFSEAILYAVAREADGSMRDAQSLLEQLLAFSGDDLPESEILDILGVLDRQSVLRTAEAILAANAPGCLDLVADVYRRGIDSRRFCQHLCDHFRNLLFVAISGSSQARLDLPEDEKKLLKDQVGRTTPESLHVYFQMLLRGEEEIRRSSMPKIALEMLLLRMAQMPKLKSIDAVLDRIATIERSLKEEHADSGCVISESRSSFRKEGGARRTGEGGRRTEDRRRAEDGRKAEDGTGAATSAAPSAPGFETEGGADAPEASSILRPPSSLTGPAYPVFHAPSSVPGPASAAKAAENWQAFVAFLENHNPIVWAKVSHCTPRASGELLELEVPDIFENSANGPQFVRELEDASQAFFGARLQWSIITRSSQSSRSGAAQERKTGKPPGAKQIAAHPAVQLAIEILGAELIDVKPAKERDPDAFGGGNKYE
ncbi:MAG TPA: DNA polymerase III subunit gamma/tau [Syntrophobacteraceae bacterium]|nr:DNA polymerase III subunit gamma/tau [Syntrophobacteraceae bacterium]